ncbi:hypothetical protein [Thermoclostridium stercorarium]|uniref:hypothetical protein n=1 Tax=Thermoclostridium stercorarium TaxID=1510 RepID=UPI0004AE87FD|nr:hypothetical protein [Thermoclostridium stercorarium]
MMNNKITEEEFYQFKKLPVQKKIDSMEAYLIGINGRRYNMEEVGGMVFGEENYSFKVLLIHRCYNFFGQNSGKYAPGCNFERNYGYRVTRKDIEDFVNTYPNGTFDIGITFEDFLKQESPVPEHRKQIPGLFRGVIFRSLIFLTVTLLTAGIIQDIICKLRHCSSELVL